MDKKTDLYASNAESLSARRREDYLWRPLERPLSFNARQRESFSRLRRDSDNKARRV